MQRTLGTEEAAARTRAAVEGAAVDVPPIDVTLRSAAELVACVTGRMAPLVDPPLAPHEPAAEIEREVADLPRLARRSVGDLCARAGFPVESALRLAAAFELGRRVERAAPVVRAPMNAPSLVHAVAAPILRGLDREEFHALLLDARHRLVRTVHVSTGTLSTSLVHPREVFVAALRESAAAIVVVHNHPSGDPEPSAQDVEVTRRLVQAGELLGVPLLDHVVVAADRWVSLRERMSWNAK